LLIVDGLCYAIMTLQIEFLYGNNENGDNAEDDHALCLVKLQ